MRVPDARAVKEVRALRTGNSWSNRIAGDSIEFTIPEVRDYEIAAITVG